MRQATKLSCVAGEFDVILWEMVCECVFACGRDSESRERGTVGIAAIELAITKNLDF